MLDGSKRGLRHCGGLRQRKGAQKTHLKTSVSRCLHHLRGRWPLGNAVQTERHTVTSPRHPSCEAYAHKGVNLYAGDVRGCARVLLLMLIHLWMRPHHPPGVSKPTQRCIKQARTINSPVWARLSVESKYGREWPIDVPVPGTLLVPVSHS